MIAKVIIIFIAGFIETLIYTFYLISIENRRIALSTTLMFFYMLAYLVIISVAIKDTNSIPLLLVYSVSCALGNLVVMNRQKHKDLSIFKHRPTHPHHSKGKYCKITKSYAKK